MNQEQQERGVFIVIEGGDGAGKDTQIDLLKSQYGEKNFLYVKDPGTTDIGRTLRNTLLNEEQVAERTELFLYLAARAQLVNERIKPALERGVNVISNRFDLSTIAYQIYGKEQHEITDLVHAMSDYVRDGLQPDLLVLLDCPPEEGLRRIQTRNKGLNKFEAEPTAFHQRVREGYRAHVTDYPHTLVIDAMRAPDDIHKEVISAIERIHTSAD